MYLKKMFEEGFSTFKLIVL